MDIRFNVLDEISDSSPISSSLQFGRLRLPIGSCHSIPTTDRVTLEEEAFVGVLLVLASTVWVALATDLVA